MFKSLISLIIDFSNKSSSRINGASIADKTLDEICDLLSMTTETHCSLTIASAGTVQGAVVPPKVSCTTSFVKFLELKSMLKLSFLLLFRKMVVFYTNI